MVEAFGRTLTEPAICTFTGSDLATEEFAQQFGDALRLHHPFSNEPFTKDSWSAQSLPSSI
jgi:hypothetical protein